MLSLTSDQLAQIDQSALSRRSESMFQLLRSRPECAAVFAEPAALDVVFQLVLSAYANGYRSQNDLARYVYLCSLLRRDIGQMAPMQKLRDQDGLDASAALDELERAVNSLGS